MKLEYIVVAVATIAAIIYYAKFDRYKPDHGEFSADYTSYSISGVPVDPEDVETDEDF